MDDKKANDSLQPIESKPWHSKTLKQNLAHSEHYNKASAQLSSVGKQAFSMIEFDENEDLVAEIRKHWFGLLLLWLVGVLVTIILVSIPFWLTIDKSLISDFVSSPEAVRQTHQVIVGIGLVLGLLAFAITAVLAKLYTSNVIFVTTDKIAQVVYRGLFYRKVSQLSIGDVQDCSIRQTNIFARLLNYGKLTVETAGEQNDFEFSFIPDPSQSTKAIIWAHEENMKRYGN